MERAVRKLESQKQALQERPEADLTDNTKRLRQTCFKVTYKRRRQANDGRTGGASGGGKEPGGSGGGAGGVPSSCGQVASGEEAGGSGESSRAENKGEEMS